MKHPWHVLPSGIRLRACRPPTRGELEAWANAAGGYVYTDAATGLKRWAATKAEIPAAPPEPRVPPYVHPRRHSDARRVVDAAGRVYAYGVREAAHYAAVSEWHMYRVCRLRVPLDDGRRFYYRDNCPPEVAARITDEPPAAEDAPLKPFVPKKRVHGPPVKPVVNDNGDYYPHGVPEAAYYVRAADTTIYTALKQRRRSRGRLWWFVDDAPSDVLTRVAAKGDAGRAVA